MGLKSLFSAPKMVEEGLDIVKKGVDAAVLTNQESTEYFLKFVEASVPMNVSRRVIATGVTFVWVLGFIEGSLVILFDHPAKQELMNFLTLYVAPSFSILTSWYFWKRISK